MLIPPPILDAALACGKLIAPANLAKLELAIRALQQTTETTCPTPRELLARNVITALPACFAQLPPGSSYGTAPRKREFEALHAAMLALANDYVEGECEASVVRLAHGLERLARPILGHPLPWFNETLTSA